MDCTEIDETEKSGGAASLIKIGAEREHDFSEPLGMLKDCHRRILRFLGVLQTVTAAAVPLGEAERTALTLSLDYFQTGGRLHHADEEESLFPRMPRTEIIESLKQEHDEVAMLHLEVEHLGRTLAATGILEPEDQAKFRSAVDSLASIYPQHLAREEAEVFAEAENLLTSEAKTALGKEMAARRGLVR